MKHKKLTELAQRKGIEQLSTLIYAWLLKHPAGIIPVLGTGKLHHDFQGYALHRRVV